MYFETEKGGSGTAPVRARTGLRRTDARRAKRARDKYEALGPEAFVCRVRKVGSMVESRKEKGTRCARRGESGALDCLSFSCQCLGIFPVIACLPAEERGGTLYRKRNGRHIRYGSKKRSKTETKTREDTNKNEFDPEVELVPSNTTRSRGASRGEVSNVTK